MKYTNLDDLRLSYKQLLDNSGIKQQFVADRLGISKQNCHRLINTKQLDFNDISQLLDVIGYELHYEFVKKTDN